MAFVHSFVACFVSVAADKGNQCVTDSSFQLPFCTQSFVAFSNSFNHVQFCYFAFEEGPFLIFYKNYGEPWLNLHYFLLYFGYSVLVWILSGFLLL